MGKRDHHLVPGSGSVWLEMGLKRVEGVLLDGTGKGGEGRMSSRRGGQVPALVSGAGGTCLLPYLPTRFAYFPRCKTLRRIRSRVCGVRKSLRKS